MARSARRSKSVVTIRSVAQQAGVSAMTVSNVVNDTGKVRPETRDLVLAAIATLGYAPNAAARALASAAMVRIGILYQESRNAFLSATLVGALNATSRAGAMTLLRRCEAVDAATVSDALHALVRSGANAILLAPPFSELVSGSVMVTDLNVPMAALAQPEPLADMIAVGIDDAGAAAAVTDLLLGAGHRRIGFIAGPERHAGSTARLTGYRHALARRGVDDDAALVVRGAFTFDSGLAAATRLLDLPDPPTAIFASSDDMAAATSSVAHRRGLAVPHDLAIVGFDDSPLATEVWPPLTTVYQPVEAMAECATDALLAAVRTGTAAGTPAFIRLDHAIRRRESAPIG